jgi:hypothetical protein
MRLTLAILLLSATAALADPQLAGTYKGIIWSAGYDDPGTTVLKVGKDGRIAGTYRYMDGSTPAKGTITDCAFAAPILSCQWNDAYGSGAWVVRFNEARTAFEGSWYDYSIEGRHDRPEGGYKWTGRKQGG